MLIRNQKGLALIEVLVGSVIVAITGVGLALMFSSGQLLISAEGDNRVSLFLAQQRLEQLRGLGGGLVPADATSETLNLTPPGSNVTKTYTRKWMVLCMLTDNYLQTPEGCTPAQYSTMAKLIIVCVVEGTVANACNPPIAPNTTVTFPASVTNDKQRPIVMSAAVSARF